MAHVLFGGLSGFFLCINACFVKFEVLIANIYLYISKLYNINDVNSSLCVLSLFPRPELAAVVVNYHLIFCLLLITIFLLRIYFRPWELLQAKGYI